MESENKHWKFKLQLLYPATSQGMVTFCPMGTVMLDGGLTSPKPEICVFVIELNLRMRKNVRKYGDKS